MKNNCIHKNPRGHIELWTCATDLLACLHEASVVNGASRAGHGPKRTWTEANRLAMIIVKNNQID